MKITRIPAKPATKKVLRVAAYARVSADKDAAFHSLEAQTEYYEAYVNNHSDWTLVGIYSDNGISGTVIDRPEFQRMLDDCRDGKIDLVVTKSITRFARNTVILLETIRELKALGIDCYFEKEQMHSISPDGELLITLLAMYAEEEARSASENQLWRVRKRFEQGIPTTVNMLGYKLVDGKIEIVPEEAEIVRQIFDDYLSGMGFVSIAKKMAESNVITRFEIKWSGQGIAKLLSNEKYVGNMLLQKKYRADFRSKKSIVNHGEKRQYFVEGSHEPIVSKDIFDAVQEERRRRAMLYSPAENHSRSENLFKGMIICGCCGHRYLRKHFSGKYGKTEWICNELYRRGKNACSSQKVPENILIEKTKDALEVDFLSRNLLEERLVHIVVPEHNHLNYIFKDGTSVDVFWEHQSRSLSWTPEMRQAARERTLRQNGKEEK